jgi:ATP-dependent helicase/DNAse subunit B
LGSLLISGPPASGKSRAALDRFLADPNSTFLTPTATMAEHVRNELARAGIPIRPNRIQTLAKFLEPFTPFAEASDSLVHLLIARFGPPSEFRSYHRSLAALFAVGRVPDPPSSIADTAQTLDDQLAQRGVALREKRLRTAQPIAKGPIILDGFFTLSQAELEFIEKLSEQTPVTVTLPDWPGSNSAREHLLSKGFLEQHLADPLRHPTRTVIAALSLEQEVEQIAKAILDHNAKGREFREMGVLLRVRDPYAGALESTFARLGIPARFHFTDPLSAHPAIQYLTGLIRALLTGWDHADLATLLRMPISGQGATPEGDRQDFEMREYLPSSGAGSRPALREIDEWKQDRLTPRDWSARLKTLRAQIPTPEITDQVTGDQLNILRSTAAALNTFDTTLDTVSQALNDEPITLQKFWPNIETAVSIEKLRIPDRRRNVVNVLDIYEARQWELPIAFVCGLNERHFPQYHREDPLLPDPARLVARQQEEHFLFDLATTRATEQTILSYARFNDKGDPQLRSFFLPEEGTPSPTARIIPSAVGRVPDPSIPNLQIHHTKLSPTSIESFLQCPFQFFARKTLKLRKRPDRPRERLNALLQGSILHQALAEGDLDRVFEEECRNHNIPPAYWREAVRLELQRHFEAFHADTTWPLNWPRKTEQTFEIPLTPALSIRGRIDRLDIGPNNEAIVIDYKYSAAAKIRERIEGDPMQAGLYLSAADRVFKHKPVGMFYCGLRQSVSWEGWHTQIPGVTVGEFRTDAALRELITIAEQKAIEVHESITAGNIEVRPTDRTKCRYCDYNNICRVESISRAKHEIPS